MVIDQARKIGSLIFDQTCKIFLDAVCIWWFLGESITLRDLTLFLSSEFLNGIFGMLIDINE